MIVIKFEKQFDFEYDVQGIIRSFYPGIMLKSVRGKLCDRQELADYEEISKQIADEQIPVEFVLQCIFDEQSMEILILNGNECGLKSKFRRIYTQNGYDRKETKNCLKRELYDLMHQYTGRELAWGTLSGIRPTKITSALLVEGKSEAEVYDYMKKEYYLSDIKAKESIDISKREIAILNRIDYQNGYSIYIGIPFCPSTCLYCSFTSNPVGLFKDKIDNYLDALFKEIDFCAERFQDKKLCSIYVGGGTPTSLSDGQLERLLKKIHDTFEVKNLYEFTVEAGRPDSLSFEKLKVIRQYDVTRISINPQTMNDDTLKFIGRHHSVDQFLKAYEMARELGFDNINMDFILGLPGEDIDDVRKSMDQVYQLKPDSLTIHSLAIKRAARLNMEQRAGKKFDIYNSEEMMQVTKETAEKLGLVPYYLYRQKNMAGNLENIGYSKESKEGIYNILIMEEKQTILALGAGSSSKMVWQNTDRIDRIENVKDVDLYIEKIDEMIDRKRRYLNENKI